MKKTDYVGQFWFNTKSERLYQRTRIGFTKNLWRDLSELLIKKDNDNSRKDRSSQEKSC